MKMKKRIETTIDFNCDDVIEWMETTDEQVSFSKAITLYADAAKLLEKATRTSSVQRIYADWLHLGNEDRDKFIKWIKQGAYIVYDSDT